MTKVGQHAYIESLPAVLGGEPVIRGTRVAAGHVADLVKQGEEPAVIAKDLDLTLAQVEAAVSFGRVTPHSSSRARNTKINRSRVPPSG